MATAVATPPTQPQADPEITPTTQIHEKPKNASLYVGDLDKEIREEQLIETFRQAGPVLSVRICRDVVTQRSLGYAYVNYQNHADAERALQTLNFTNIGNQQVRVMWQQRDPALRYSGNGNVFIKNLGEDVDHKALFDMFSSFGNILSCKVMVDDQGKSRHYGFVHFETEGSAKDAIVKMDGKDERDQMKLFVTHFMRRNLRIAALVANFTNVYIKQVLPTIDEDAVKKFFAKFGGVTSACAKKDARGRVFAFCNFNSHEDAVKAIEESHNKAIDGITPPGESLFVQRAQHRSERLVELRQKYMQRQSLGNNLYVRNFDLAFDTDELKDLFKEFGEIVSATVAKDENGVSKGFGFVCFATAEQANHALREMNGRLVQSKPLFVNIAQRRDHRHSMLQIQFQHRFSGRSMQMMPYYSGGMAPGPRTFKGPVMPRAGPPAPGAPRAGPGPRGPGPVPGPRPTGGVPSSRPQATVGPSGSTPQFTVTRTPGQTPPQVPQTPPLIPLSAAELASMSKDEQKSALGERLFAKIFEQSPDYAPKITGMLLEMDFMETIHLLETPEKLNEKVQEAMCVLRAHELKQGK